MKTNGNLFWTYLFGLMALMTAGAQAQLTFTTNNGAITITGYNGNPTVLTIPDATNGYPVTSIGDNAFISKLSLVGITIPDSVANIGVYAFQGCQLTNINFGNGITNIGSFAFTECGPVSSFILPSGLISIGDSAFSGCWMTGIKIPDSVTTIGSDIFSGCTRLTNVDMGTNAKSIGQGEFAGCPNLNQFSIGSSVTNIGEGAFASSGLTSITIPDNVISVGKDAFQFCSSLTTVTLDNGVTSLGDDAFFYSGLTNIVIPGSVTNIGTPGTPARRIFAGAGNLKAITVVSNNPAFSSVGGVLFDVTRSTLIECPDGLHGSFVMPDSTANIDNWAFEYCTNLNSIIIADNVTNIGAFAFQGCTGLTNIVIGSSVSTVGQQTFSGCTSLVNITFPSSIKSIGPSAFLYCNDLTSVYFRGDAPSVGTPLYIGDSPGYVIIVTNYYLPGTMGWGALLGDRPTAPWYLPNPSILGNNSSFGVSTHGFGFTISWATNSPVVVEACTNLINPNWQAVATNVLASGSAYFSDAQWTNYPGRFYRVRMP